MPGKRAASKAAATPSKAAKVARIETEVDHFLVAVAPVLELVSQADDLSEDCKELLQSSAPLCLRAPKGERHEYQEKMIEAIAKVFADIEAARQASVVGAQADIVDVAASKEAAAAALAAAQEAVEASNADSAEKAAAVQAATEAVNAALTAVAEAAARVGSLESEKAEAGAEKGEYERLFAETFESLKQGTIPNWRVKAKLIDDVVKMLDKVGIDVSLKDALPVALKAKPSERGSFAQKALEFGEEHLKKHIAELTAKLVGFDAEAELRAKTAADAESDLTAKTTVLDEKTKELKDAKVASHEKDGVLSKAKKAAKALEPRSKEVATALANAEAALNSVKELISKFQDLREGYVAPAAAAPAVAEALEPVSAEAPAEASEAPMEE